MSSPRCSSSISTPTASASSIRQRRAENIRFDPFPSDEVLFGLRVVHRQTWHLLDYARGELVKTIPLGPKESQKISVRTLRRTKRARTAEEGSSFETSAESSAGTKDTSEVVDEASLKLNVHAEAEVGVDIFTLVKANVSAGASADSAVSSKQTKGRLNELMEKTANRMKRDTKVTVSTEQEVTFEETRSSELTNPNDELAVTYLYHRLQQRYWVSTEVAEVHSVVFVPRSVASVGRHRRDLGARARGHHCRRPAGSRLCAGSRRDTQGARRTSPTPPPTCSRTQETPASPRRAHTGPSRVSHARPALGRAAVVRAGLRAPQQPGDGSGQAPASVAWPC